MSIQNGKRICKLNWENEMIVSLLDEVTPTEAKKIKTLLRLIEEYLPVETIAIEEVKDEKIPMALPFEECSDEEREDFLNAITDIFTKKGIDITTAKQLTNKLINIK